MKIGVVGGTGLYDVDGMENVREVAVETPFGEPSDFFICGELNGVELFFLPRHGRGHRLLPSEINHKANIYGFKKLGVDRIISISAVGSLQESISPRDIVLVDQYFDRTKKILEHTFFGNGVVAHVSFGDPVCPELRQIASEAAHAVVASLPEDDQVDIHDHGTYVNMEGPAFSTRAESVTYHELGFDVIGMTCVAEAKLCRESEICYQSMAMVTDYDSWHESDEPVTTEMIIGHLTANSALAKKVLVDFISRIPEDRSSCDCARSLSGSIMTKSDDIPEETRKSLDIIISKYL